MNFTDIQIPPHSIEDEQSTLGAILVTSLPSHSKVDASETWYAVTESVDTPDFYRESHRMIFAAMKVAHERGMPVDILTLQGILKSQNNLENAGGFAYLAQLTKDTPSAANVKHYAKRVKVLATKRRFIENMTAAMGVAFSDSSDENELSALLETAGASIARLELEQTGGDRSVSMRQAQKQALGLMELYASKRGGVIGIDTGLQSLNDAIGGWHDTDMIVVQARSGMGKTAFAMSLAKAAAKNSRVGFISTEMASSQLALRRIAQSSGVGMGDIRRGNITEDGWSSISHAIYNDVQSGLAERIWINEEAIELDAIKRQARAWKRERGIELLIVDYLQNIAVSNRKGITGEKVQEVMAVSRELKQLAKQLKIPVIALAQTKRDVDARSDKRPSNADVMWASQIEQDADVMIGLYRHAKYVPDFCSVDEAVKNMAEVIVTKNRHGELATHYCVFHPQRMDFLDADPSGIIQYQQALAPKPETTGRKSFAKEAF